MLYSTTQLVVSKLGAFQELHSRPLAPKARIQRYMLYTMLYSKTQLVVSKLGAFQELHSGPLAPKARIMPLEQMP